MPTHIKLAHQYGILVPGWDFVDYCVHAVKKDGYETGAIHGTQGSGKSCCLIQYGYDILARTDFEGYDEDSIWEATLEHIVFKPSDFVIRLEEVPRDNRLPVILWDDIGVHYTSSTFRTDILQYQAIDATWAAIRTKVAVCLVTIPVITRLAKNVKDNLTFEIFIGRNQKRQIRRLFYLPGTRYIDSNLFKPQLERPAKFDLYRVPEWVWKEYWEMRLNLTEEALANLRAVTDMEEDEGFISIPEAVKLCRESGLNWSASTIQQNSSRGLYRGQKMNGLLCVERAGLLEILEAEKIPLALS